MKRRISILAVIVLAATMIMSSFSVVFAQNDYLKVQDLANIIDDTKEAEIEAYLESTCASKQFDVVIVTTNKTDIDLESSADDFYDKYGFGYGDNHDGCLLLITADSQGPKDYHISTTGYGITALTDYGIQYLGENLVSDFKNNNIGTALLNYSNNVFDLYDLAKAGTPYDAPPKTFNWVRSIIFSLIAGFLVALILAAGQKRQLKSVRLQRAASNYLREGSLNVKRHSDVYLYSTVTSVARPENNNNGGSSTHIGSSGTTHGGGGGSFR